MRLEPTTFCMARVAGADVTCGRSSRPPGPHPSGARDAGRRPRRAHRRAREKVGIAARYYAEYPDEIDRWISMVEEEAERDAGDRRRPRARHRERPRLPPPRGRSPRARRAACRSHLHLEPLHLEPPVPARPARHDRAPRRGAQHGLGPVADAPTIALPKATTVFLNGRQRIGGASGRRSEWQRKGGASSAAGSCGVVGASGCKSDAWVGD
jgi:hypothetical protein